ncbi:efflux RND transporter periplasmic adaptor subunit [Gluconobacter wancherniae]|uniref:Uncharacterized protein n=1 Tax=Gluconobacter wancherniae NBRC 103581 TaxID=656744 RepID=A0A511B3K1_9PROT|nr:efflux RND transporter periplasmic adaptor subunit [Gluconobacter wancherniae]MBF0854071.1 efflux RND transporter periplasmic adaptor subunit [Gluconobacter wancherniae]GBD57127.1 RND transporter [Gluconobacter wancherniae NBRC 103581]GBR65236.1 membrane-fusion protein [Gluconobacter wancherniae NBRC 103581]GEK94101.1 hypothetical protein GWA01_18710 [Gluconobacter wancherniae NBRC 103581]
MKYIFCLAAAFLSFSANATPTSQPSVVPFSTEAQQTEGLTLAKPVTGRLTRTLHAMASVVADISRTVHVQAAGSGKVLSVNVLPGQTVALNQTLVTYTDHSLHLTRLQETQAQAALKSALAARSDAASAYQRARLLNGSTVSLGEMQRRQAAFQAAQATVAAREAEIGMYHHQFEEEYNSTTEKTGTEENSSLLSPVPGIVESINTAISNDIRPGIDIAVVADLSTVWIVTDVPPQDVAHLQVGAAQTTLIDGHQILSKINTIQGATDPATGLVRIVSVVANGSGNLRPGMMGDTTLTTSEGESGLIVPSDAVQQVHGHDFVFVPAGKNEFRALPIQTGIETENQIVVLSGLPENTPIVTTGSFALKSVLLHDESGAD